MILQVNVCREALGVLEAKVSEVIHTYMRQINDEGRGDTYSPAELSRFIKRLVSHLEEHPYELLFDYDDARLSIFGSTDMHTPLYRIYWGV